MRAEWFIPSVHCIGTREVLSITGSKREVQQLLDQSRGKGFVQDPTLGCSVRAPGVVCVLRDPGECAVELQQRCPGWWPRALAGDTGGVAGFPVRPQLRLHPGTGAVKLPLIITPLSYSSS